MPHETVYVGKLLDVYSEPPVPTSRASVIWRHMQAGRLIYRNSAFASFRRKVFLPPIRTTEPGTMESFAEQIFDAIDPHLASSQGPGLARLSTALTIAGQTIPASVLSAQAEGRSETGCLSPAGQ